jgi:hypothetical protein
MRFSTAPVPLSSFLPMVRCNGQRGTAMPPGRGVGEMQRAVELSAPRFAGSPIPPDRVLPSFETCTRQSAVVRRAELDSDHGRDGY